MGNTPSRSKSITLKVLKIQVGQTLFPIISNDQSTSGSLLDEIIKITNNHTIVGLESKVSEALDYLLTIDCHKLDLLNHEDTLFAVIGTEIPEEFSISAFKPIKLIGKGGFSIVTLARKIDTGKLYAIKTIKKAILKAEEKLLQVVAEKEIMKSLAHPFIVELVMATQNSLNCHLIMEFCPGGELFFHLHTLKRLSEDHAKFYFGEILLAIEYLHKNEIVYRDLKPENVLLDIDGHVKIIDFGLSKQNIGKNTVSFSFCGSPEYMSPEMVNGQAHGRTIDYYGLGAILFEMLVGFPPYYSPHKDEIEWGIKNLPLEIPNFLSRPCKGILKRLLEKNPENRIGYSKGIDEIKNHPWCRGYPWAKLLRKQVKPPFVPNSRISNFSEEFCNSEVPEEIFFNDRGDIFEDFDFVSENLQMVKKRFQVNESFTSSTSKRSEKNASKENVYSEESCLYSNSMEGEKYINEIPKFESKFFNN